MAAGVWKGVYLLFLGRSRQLSLNKFFDPSIPSMRKEWCFQWPLRHYQQSTARTTTAGTPHARAKITLVQDGQGQLDHADRQYEVAGQDGEVAPLQIY